MMADDTEPAAQQPRERGSSAAQAYERRSRREGAVAAGRLTRTGSPVAAAMSRLPFVATVLLLLAAGIVGVLWLNTMSDATGLQATASRIRQAATETEIQALQKDVNTLRDPARLAAEASRLGMVPAGDAALLQVGADGKATVVGTPTPVAGRVVAVPTTPVTTPAATTPAASTPAATTPAASTPAVATTPTTDTTPTTTPTTDTTPTTTPTTDTTPITATTPTTAAKTAPANSTAARTSVTTSARTTTSAKTTPVGTTPARAALASTTSIRSSPAPAQHVATTTTGAGR